MRQTPRNDAHFNIVLPQALIEAVREVAAAHWVSANHYARTALLEQLRRDGVKVDAKSKAA